MTSARDPLVMIVLFALTGVGFLNLVLLLRLVAIVRPATPTIGLPPGTVVPSAATLTFSDADAASADRRTLPAAFVFLSAGCPACRDAVAMTEAQIAAADRAGLDLRVVVADDAAEGLAWLGPPLASRAIRLSRRSYRRLNPHGAVPSYLFVDHRGIVQASGHVGDEGWRSLEAQLAEA